MRAFGSGYFGEWINDEAGLPAYQYNCDHLNDPKAVTPANPTWRRENDHTFQFGNDRIIGVVSNSGTVQVRQDEGAPKFLGSVDPQRYSYGGGLGWLKDGDDCLSTYYDGAADDFRRVFGVGYTRKTARKGDVSADQLIFAPYGDDPVLISRVTITNHSGQAKDLKWFEYWSAQPYVFSYRALLLSLGEKTSNLETFINNSADNTRREFAEKYEHHYVQENNTLGERKKFSGFGLSEKAVWGIVQRKYRPLAEKAHNASLYVGELEDMEDISPPPTFLHAADAPIEGFITNGKAFFGGGGTGRPDGLAGAIKYGKMKKGDTAMIAVSPVSLPPGESVTLTYVYGYLPEGFDQDALLRKYSGDFDRIFADSCTKWKANRISLKIPGQDWVDRELLWHNSSLRSAAAYDSAMGEHILSQGHVYQYIMGFQGAARDPLQHVMPFIFTEPALVREVIRYTLKETLPDGEIPYGMCGHGAIMLSPILSSDFELWLLWTVSEYILGTKDVSILGETVEPYPYKGVRQEKQPVSVLLNRCFTHFKDSTGLGEHGLPRLKGGDWNDNIVMGSITPEQHERIYADGESVLVGAMAAAVLALYADALALAGLENAEVAAYAAGQREAVARVWNGKWLNRAWLGGELGWVGEELLWLEPQPWAVLGEALSLDQRDVLLNSIKERVQDPSPIGALLSSECPPQMKLPPGTVTNGGIWPSINGTLILALSRTSPEDAWEEWRKNTLAYHAEVYPESWEGIWSGPDSYNSVLAEHPGRAYYEPDPEKRKLVLNWSDYPVYNLHPHAWPLYNAACMFIERFTKDGIVYSVGFPEREYEFSSPLAGLTRKDDILSGWYAPMVSGSWLVELAFSEGVSYSNLIVNGNPAESLGSSAAKGGRISFRGEGGPESPLRWSIAVAPTIERL